MRLNVQTHEHEREFDWEINSWVLSWDMDAPDAPSYPFNIWHDKGAIVVTNVNDLYEQIQLDTVEEANDLIDRLTKARKDVFGV